MRKPRRMLIGIAAVLLVTVILGAPVFALNLTKMIEVRYRDIKIYVDGEIVVTADASGRIVEPFIYDGATYLPIRAVSEALGMTVEWDGVTNSVYIGESIPQEIKEITVSSAEEFVAALGSNRRILLQEGEYNLSTVSASYIHNPSVSLRQASDGPELVLTGIDNLHIQGVGDEQSELIIEPRYAFVLCFEDCSRINITNIKAGHTEAGDCEGGVFSFERSSGIQINDTLMYGCGTYGLQLAWVADMKVAGSSVYGCTYGAMMVSSSADIMFENCVFRDNTGLSMVEVKDSERFTIDRCEFLRNTSDWFPVPMFSFSDSENVVVKNTLFKDNVADALIEQADFEWDASNTFENNSFDSNGRQMLIAD
ncbi:MAG: right-handed parallel beta-helix repeat-containing protein [Clostridiales bacterium]|nr:right-handed parallel beta-helix repeat-containing protein [Clostridiales bacterium]